RCLRGRHSAKRNADQLPHQRTACSGRSFDAGRGRSRALSAPSRSRRGGQDSGAGEDRMTTAEREALIVEHLSLIKHIAHRVATRLPASVEISDLVNAGVLGLIDAVDKFQPDRGVKFKTYAELRVRGAMIDSLRDIDWAPRSLRRKSRDLERVYGELE